MQHTLLFASKSLPRRQLLEQAKIPFNIIEQHADEAHCDWALPFPTLLESIAIHKMNHVILPEGKEGEQCFVLTCDTMLQSKKGTILGKPTSKEHAVAMIKESREGGVVASVFCLDKKIVKNSSWQVAERITKYVDVRYTLDFPDTWIERYLEEYPEYLNIAGALNIEDYGMQFVKTIEGSYSTAIGLPLFELREALEKLGFFT